MDYSKGVGRVPCKTGLLSPVLFFRGMPVSEFVLSIFLTPRTTAVIPACMIYCFTACIRLAMFLTMQDSFIQRHFITPFMSVHWWLLMVSYCFPLKLVYQC